MSSPTGYYVNKSTGKVIEYSFATNRPAVEPVKVSDVKQLFANYPTGAFDNTRLNPSMTYKPVNLPAEPSFTKSALRASPYALLGMTALDIAIAKTKEAYVAKMYAAGISKDSNNASLYGAPIKPFVAPPDGATTPPDGTTTAPDGTTTPPDGGSSPSGNLLTVLSKNGADITNAINGVNKSLNYRDEVDLAYRDMQASLMIDIAMALSAIANSLSSLPSSKTNNDSSAGSASVNVTFPDSMRVSVTDVPHVLSEFYSKKSQNLELEKSLATKSIEKINYELTPVPVKDLDGNTITTIKPVEAQTVKNLSDARYRTDQNTFEVNSDDFDDILSGINISEIFKFSKKSDRLDSLFAELGIDKNSSKVKI